mmetsp:Transcript_36230/g.73008  ORF Transcript_36230/g.73008 Transcript_36230/m.73008 type:complete len:273 (+) Transcript_36230:249-1067(+)
MASGVQARLLPSALHDLSLDVVEVLLLAGHLVEAAGGTGVALLHPRYQALVVELVAAGHRFGFRASGHGLLADHAEVLLHDRDDSELIARVARHAWPAIVLLDQDHATGGQELVHGDPSVGVAEPALVVHLVLEDLSALGLLLGTLPRLLVHLLHGSVAPCGNALQLRQVEVQRQEEVQARLPELRVRKARLEHPEGVLAGLAQCLLSPLRQLLDALAQPSELSAGGHEGLLCGELLLERGQAAESGLPSLHLGGKLPERALICPVLMKGLA